MNIGLGIGIPFTRSSLWASIFTPSALFLDGSTQGVWYDPSDDTTLFQDAAATIPVTAVEQPVGLMLDKSKGLVLGPEFVTNGDFSNGTTGWSSSGNAALSWQAGKLRVQRTDTSAYPVAAQNISFTPGRMYVLEADYVNPSGLNVFFSIGFIDQATLGYATSGHLKIYIFATGASTRVEAGIRSTSGVVGQYIDFDNISVRELPGNHAFNTSGNSANFPVLSARVNLLERTEEFTNAYWVKNASVTVMQSGNVGTISVPNTVGSGTNLFFKQSVLPFANGATTLNRIEVRCTTGQRITLASDRGFSQITMTSEWQTVSLTSTIASGFHQFYIRTVEANQAYSFDIRFPDMRISNDGINLPSYQRVNTATDYDTVGFKPYVRFNGVSQWLQTNSIDFSYGDKMFVCAGVRKLSDAAIGAVLELSTNSNTNNGAIWLLSPGSPATDQHSFRSKGTSAADANSSGYPAPITNVISGIGNISGDQAILRVNGTQAAISTANQGTGNYGNYPLYIGARAGTSLFFNGRLYQLVIAAGSEIRVAEEDSDLFLSESGDFITAETTVAVIQSAIEQTEAFVNRKTSAF